MALILLHSGAVTVASADEVTGVWSTNHILKLSSQQVACMCTAKRGGAEGELICACDNIMDDI